MRKFLRGSRWVGGKISRTQRVNKVPVDLPVPQQSYAETVTKQSSGSHTSCGQDRMSEMLKQLSQITTTMNTLMSLQSGLSA